MLISCPYCGPRDVVEFSYQGDANRARPDPMSNDPQAWTDYVFRRTNAAGPHREYWQHAGGCRAHLVVVRDTTTHEIRSVDYARGATAAVAAIPARPKPARRSAAAPTQAVAKAIAKSAVKPAPVRKPATRSRKKPA